MQIEIESQPYASVQADALITYVFDTEKKFDGLLGEIDGGMNGRLASLAASGELTGKSLELLLVHFPAGLAAQRLLLVGAGKPEKFSAADLRKLAGTALRHLKSRGMKKLIFLTREGEDGPAAAQAVVEGLVVADFESDKYRTEKKSREIQSVKLAGFDAGLGANLTAAIDQGRVVAESQNFARDLINEPSNRLTPRMLAARAEAMAKEVGLGVEILDERKIAELKMGALIGVAQGSVEPPRVIVLRYTPENPRPGGPVLGLVGKAVTFDTGGISIKPSANMEKMKYDMGGGATMIGAMRALASLKPSVPVIAVIPATENMPGGRAQKPGDVQTAMSGKTIEVINTDAEGRLILADGIFYARQLGCTHLVDAATLTGAIEVALANVNVGAFGTPREYLDQFLESAKAVGEKMWPMPMDDEYEEMIKSNIADIRNTSTGKGGGAITAAWFLKEFAEDTPWVHLDIASTCWLDDGRPWLAKGPTGVAIRSIVDFALKM
ncbi:MAG TPA: leucyl aminopeptidase [Candidatus Polarisedimenticolia bacterium]|nr:leucyl aminopeptidase [Candidatus Polarisedimenticolia bacterium]